MQLENFPATPVRFARADALAAAITSAANMTFDIDSDYLVKNWLSRHGISLVYGDSNVGKTFFAIDLGFHVAAGMQWQGNRVRQRPVLYIATEGGASVRRRIAALKLERPELATGAGAFYLLPVQVDLHGTDDVQAIIQAAPAAKYGIIVVDTLAQSFGAGSENDGKDMGLFIANIALLKQHFGGHVMIVHHSGKDVARGARGHSSLRAAVDTEIELKQDGVVRVATVTKQRDMPVGGKAAYTLQCVTLGTDCDGDEVTSCVVEPTDYRPAKCRRRLRGFNDVALQALRDVMQKHGRRIQGSDSLPASRRTVAISLWREEAMRRGIGADKSDEAARKAFDRARAALQELDYTREDGGNVWLIDEEEDMRDN
jgi:hypothetical protein